MSIIKYRVSWEDDDSTFREFEILSSQTFYEFHEGIKKAFMFPAVMEASFFVSTDDWKREKEISSTVEKNLRDAPALSMKKTPLGALISDPHQKFIYACVHAKAWVLLIETITLLPVPIALKDYPICVKSEGLSPSQIGIIPTEKDSVMEIEERYDLNNTDGFGDEGEDDDSTDGLFADGESDEAPSEDF